MRLFHEKVFLNEDTFVFVRKNVGDYARDLFTCFVVMIAIVLGVISLFFWED